MQELSFLEGMRDAEGRRVPCLPAGYMSQILYNCAGIFGGPVDRFRALCAVGRQPVYPTHPAAKESRPCRLKFV